MNNKNHVLVKAALATAMAVSMAPFMNPNVALSYNALEESINNTSSKTKAIKLAKQALEINPENIDAECFIAEFEENQIKKLSKMEAIIEKATKLLEKDNMFDKENIGHFWGMIETFMEIELK